MTDFVDVNGLKIEEPKGFIKTRIYELDGGALESPIYVGHKRGHNWSARLDGKNAVDPQRAYLKVRDGVFDLGPIKAGDAIAIAGDYRTYSGRLEPNRIWGVVVEKNDETLRLDIYETEARAISAARKGIRSAPETQMAEAA